MLNIYYMKALINLFTYKDMKMIKPEHSSSNTFSKAGHSFAMILARLGLSETSCIFQAGYAFSIVCVQIQGV